MDIVTGAIGGILSTLAGDLLKSAYMGQTDVEKQVDYVTKELKSAEAFLKKIDQVPPDQLDVQDKVWASEVREASYDMDDILDTYLLCIEGPAEPITKKRKFSEMVLNAGRYFISKAKDRHGISNMIEQVNNKVREIAERRQRYRILDRHVVSVPAPSSQIDPRIALVYRTNTSLLVGINERKDDIMRMLSQQDGISENKTKVVSLLGFGGVGKTTLAKAAYDQLKDEYRCGAFVSVGQKPKVEKVLKGIFYYLDKEKFEKVKTEEVGVDVLISELLDFLKDKRYLIVVDDVWETQARETILHALADNVLGSRIIITTRKLEVATGAGEVYKVQPLSNDDSKRLFHTRIFGDLENQHNNVSDAEDKILKKCGGVPLAIITMASYLVGKSRGEWLEVCKSIGFCGKGKEQTRDTEWILSLSYRDLPSHLKTCLLYLSVFPEDHMISKHALIWMWIAEGFVDNGKPGDGLFEIGEGYFNELINRSLIQPVEVKYSMVVEGCRVHDTILDLIRSLSHEANFATVLDNGEEIPLGSSARRFGLRNRAVNTPQDNCLNTKRVRSFITVSCSFGPRVQLQSFELLRMLYLEDCNGVEIDEHVGDLRHLRCLGIHGRYDRYELPKEIGALKFLRVLCLGHWPIGGLLPSSVGMLTQLVCLYAPGMDLPGCTIKDLVSLQELRIRNLKGDDSMSKGPSVNDLCNLSELRVLVINCSNMDMRMKSDLLTSVGNLHKLQHLDMINGFSVGLPSCIHPSHLPRLSHLSLQLDSLSDEDLQIMGGLPDLCYLRLATLEGRASLTGTESRGYFKKLRSCLLPQSMVLFVVNEEDLSVSFTIWHESADAPAFGSKRVKKDKCRAARGAVMPNLGALLFQVNVAELTACNNGSWDSLGLEYLASLQKVTVYHNSSCDAGADVVEQQKAALRHTIQVHPNRPTLRLEYW